MTSRIGGIVSREQVEKRLVEIYSIADVRRKILYPKTFWYVSKALLQAVRPENINPHEQFTFKSKWSQQDLVCPPTVTPSIWQAYSLSDRIYWHARTSGNLTVLITCLRYGRKAQSLISCMIFNPVPTHQMLVVHIP